MKKTKSRALTKATRTRTSAKGNASRKPKAIKNDNIIDVKPSLLKLSSARAMAKSLKDAADRSESLASSPFHSAMSILNNLIAHLELQKARLEAAKKELRALYDEEDDRDGGEPHPPREFGTHRGGPAEALNRPQTDLIRKRARRGRQPKPS